MAVRDKLSRGSHRLQNIGVSGRVTMLNAVGHLFNRAAPTPALVARSYAEMQERLRTSLEEVEQKKRQLKESEAEITRSRDFPASGYR